MCPAAFSALVMLAVAQGATAPDPLDTPPHMPVADAQQEPEHRFLLLPIPLLGYNSDEGIGAGIALSLHHRVRGTAMLKDEVSFRVFATTSLVQRHELRWEGVDVLGTPLRIFARVGYFSTLTQPYCGRGNAVTCADSVATEAAFDEGLAPDSSAYDTFVRRYYAVRYIRPHADTLVRWRVLDDPRVEVFGGWRLSWHVPGTLFERGPWPGSLYAGVHPDGEAGIASVPQLGVTFDTRDFEPAPTRGVFVEASLRASHPFVGSSWTWAGGNVTAALYQVLVPAPQLVWAGRVIVDVIEGDAATEDILQIGGTRNFGAFGGQWIGRGVRDRRYLGKVKAVHQSELRLHVASFEIIGIHVDSGIALLADVGYIGWDVNDLDGAVPGQPWPAGHPAGLVYGLGIGLRFVANRGVVAQAQMAGSPLERRSPSFYTPVGNSW